MSEPPPEPVPPDQQRAMDVVHDVIQRRRSGEAILDDDVVRAFPDLTEWLRPLLLQAAAVAEAAEQAAAAPWLDLMDRLDADSLFEEGPAEGSTGPRITLDPGASSGPDNQRTTPTGGGRTGPARPTRAIRNIRQRVDGADREADDAVGFRPTQRPPQARLCIVDDDQVRAEVFRLREDETVIGRTAGAVTIPHDSQMSAEHASITREQHESSTRWILRDLNSRNGVFVRAEAVRLKDGDVMMLGGHRVVFSDRRPEGLCTLREVGQGGEGNGLTLEAGSEYWLGRDADHCAELLRDAPQLGRRHARLHADGAGCWRIVDNQSTNGVWILVDEVELSDRVAFQLGEQRFWFELDQPG